MGLTSQIETAAYELDGVAPSAVVEAKAVDDVVDAIRAANDAEHALVPWGGGTRASVGDVLERYDVALDLRGLRGVVAYAPDDLVITVGAGTTLAELAEVLAPRRQRWPVEPGLPERATVGGTIAAAADGPSRLRFFHPRDWTIGVQAVLGDGTLTRAGGRVVKNVSGYDLTKLYSGTFGTLCVLTELTLKLTALAETQVTLRGDLVDLDQAYGAAQVLLADHLPLDALAIVTGPAAETVDAPTLTGLFVRLAGSPRVVARLRDSLTPLAWNEVDGAVWGRIAALPLEADASSRLTYPAGALLPHPGAGGGVLYPGVEILHSFGVEEPDAVRSLRSVVEGNGGALILERAPASLRRAVGTWGTPRLPPQIARSLKSRFDPRGVLAPGRIPLA